MLKPLIQSFTKNLSSCAGCGNGKIVKYRLQVEVETENDNDDLFSLANTDRSKWKVVGGSAIHGSQSEGTVVTRNQFQDTITQPTPALNG